MFELKLAPTTKVVRGSDHAKLKYKLTKIKTEYEMINSKTLAHEAQSVYTYDHIQLAEKVLFSKGTETRLKLRVNPQRRSLRAILLHFVETYIAGTRNAEKYMNPDLTKVSVTVNVSPNRLYNSGFKGMDVWEEVKR